MLLIYGEKMSDTIDPLFFYGKPQVKTYVKIIYVLSTVYKLFFTSQRIT